MSRENEIQTNSTLIKCVVKLLGSCGTELALAFFNSTDDLSGNVMEDPFRINGRRPVVPTSFLCSIANS